MEPVGAEAVADVHIPAAEPGADASRDRDVRDIRKDVGIEAIGVDRRHVPFRVGIAAPGVGVGVAEVVATERVGRDLVGDRDTGIYEAAEVVERSVPELAAIDGPQGGIGGPVWWLLPEEL